MRSKAALVWYEESAKIVLQNVQKAPWCEGCGATRPQKQESELKGVPGLRYKVRVNLSFGSGYTEALLAASADTLEDDEKVRSDRTKLSQGL